LIILSKHVVTTVGLVSYSLKGLHKN